MANNNYPTKVTEQIGLRIGLARKIKFSKAYIFAKAMSVGAGTVSNWEAGRIAFTADQVFEISEMLGVDPAWLLTGRKELEPEWLKKGEKDE